MAVSLLGCSGGGSGGAPTAGGSGGAIGSGGSSGSGGVISGSGGQSGNPGGSGGQMTGSGGTAGKQGEVDAGPAADAGSPGDGAGAGCPAGALVCEDFEKYAAGGDVTAGGWSVMQTSATVQVDTTKPFAGGKGLHLTAPGGGAKTAALLVRQGAPLFPIAGNSFYGRMMVWITDAPAGVHFNNVIASGNLPNSTRIAKYGFGALAAKTTAAYTVRNDPAGPPVVDCYFGGGPAVPTRQWVCVEWRFDGAGNEMHYWYDGKPVSDVVKNAGVCVAGSAPVWTAPTFADIQLGWFQNQASTIPLEMWMDDIVIHDTQRVGCPMK
ncbi:MAG TPA: hypothetical protein VNO55_16570 [Polyangia bacterium]|nr:hypothetical protein [Polyangia bacterium]